MARYQVGLQTEARIVEAARQLLAERGLEATTLKSICDRAGVKAGSFYNLFDSKEEVILRVVGDAIRAVDPHPDDGADETLDELVEAYVAFITTQPDLARVYVLTAVTGGSSGARKRFLRHHERRVQRFARALDTPDADEPDVDEKACLEQSEVLLGALDGLAFRWVLDVGFDFPTHARAAALRFG